MPDNDEHVIGTSVDLKVRLNGLDDGEEPKRVSVAGERRAPA